MSWFKIIKEVEVEVGTSDAYLHGVSKLLAEYFDMRKLPYEEEGPNISLKPNDTYDTMDLDDKLNDVIFDYLPESPTVTLTLSEEMITAFDEILETYKTQGDE
tara:strand:+ start:407 stop:715 length:309 start_codon:yes stop_codon:yes gene_type:complete